MHHRASLRSAAFTTLALTAPPALAGEYVTFLTNKETVTDLSGPTGSLRIGDLTLSLTAAAELGTNPLLRPAQQNNGEVVGIGVRTDEVKWTAIQRGESLTLTFDRDVTLRQIDMALVGPTPETAATVRIGDAPAFRVYGKQKTSTVEPETPGVAFEGVEDVIDFTGDGIAVPAGTPVFIGSDADNDAKKAFMLSGLTVELSAPPLVEEPG